MIGKENSSVRGQVAGKENHQLLQNDFLRVLGRLCAGERTRQTGEKSSNLITTISVFEISRQLRSLIIQGERRERKRKKRADLDINCDSKCSSGLPRSRGENVRTSSRLKGGRSLGRETNLLIRGRNLILFLETRLV